MKPYQRSHLWARIMTALSAIGAALVVVFRGWLAPAQRDIDTGLFTTSNTLIILMLGAVVLLAAFVYLLRGTPRQEIRHRPALLLSVTLLVVGAAMVLFGLLELLARVGILRFYIVSEVLVEAAALSRLLQWLQTLFCLLGGVALVRYGLVLASENGTRSGAATWSLLAPVMWVWFVLANYEMSYASMVRLSDGFFTLMMYVFEMVFLFAFARYMSGVGNMSVGLLLFCSGGATLFAVSTPLVRMMMYLRQDAEAVTAGVAGSLNLAMAIGLLDLAIGLLALVTALTLCRSMAQPPVLASPVEEDAPVWSAPVEDDSDVELIDPVEEESEE